MADVLRRILYPTFVATIIATLWAMGSAQASVDQAHNRTYWPALNPQLFHVAEEPADPGHAPTVVVSLDDER